MGYDIQVRTECIYKMRIEKHMCLSRFFLLIDQGEYVFTTTGKLIGYVRL